MDEILSNLRSGGFDEAVFLAMEAHRFGATIEESTYSQWRANAIQCLKWYLPKLPSSHFDGSEPTMSLKCDTFGIGLISTIVRCFEALHARKEFLEATLLFYSISSASAAQWIELCNEFMVGNDLSLASHACILGIRSVAPFYTTDISMLDDVHKQMLLELWYRRSRIFELQNRLSDSVAAIKVYARLSEDFALEKLQRAQKKASSSLQAPMAYRAQKRLELKRNTREFHR